MKVDEKERPFLSYTHVFFFQSGGQPKDMITSIQPDPAPDMWDFRILRQYRRHTFRLQLPLYKPEETVRSCFPPPSSLPCM